MTPSDEPPPRFHEGARLFNERDWFEAHETWEDLWHDLEGQPRRFVQAIIQLAVVMVHLQRGNPRGVRAVLKSATQRLDAAGIDQLWGCDGRRLLHETTRHVQPVLDLSDDPYYRPGARFDALPVAGKPPRVELRSAADGRSPQPGRSPH